MGYRILCVRLPGKQGLRENSDIYLLNEGKLSSNLKKINETHSDSAKVLESAENTQELEAKTFRLDSCLLLCTYRFICLGESWRRFFYEIISSLYFWEEILKLICNTLDRSDDNNISRLSYPIIIWPALEWTFVLLLFCSNDEYLSSLLPFLPAGG